MKILNRIARAFGYMPARRIVQSGVIRSVGFDAGKLGNIFSDWTTQTLSIDSIISNQQKTLVARSRDLAENAEYIIAFLRMLRNNVLGDAGIQLRMQCRDLGRVTNGSYVPGPLDGYANRMISQAWLDWCKKPNCTVTRDMTWIEVCQLVLRTVAVDGELFAICHPFNNDHRFAIQLLETEYVDINNSKKLADGQIRMGIELDSWGCPVAYHVRKTNPNDNLIGAQILEKETRIPASKVIHPFVPLRLNATRGLPWIVSAAKRMNHLEAYENAEVVASRIASEKMGFFECTGDTQFQGEEQDDGSKIMDSEPGSFMQLPQGLKLSSWDPQHPNTNYDAFMARALRGVSAALGVSYNILGDDMASVNFSSGRLGLQEPRENYKAIQKWFIDDWCMPVFEAWLETFLAFGKSKLPSTKIEKFKAGAVWRGRRWAYIEPAKDSAAAVQRINSCQTSVSQVLADQGIDRDELLDEIAADKEAMAERGLEFSEIYQAAAAKAAPFGETESPKKEPEDDTEEDETEDDTEEMPKED